MDGQSLDRTFIALADPGRRAMIEQLSRGPANVKHLAGLGGMRLPSALKHLRVLEDGGLVVSQKSGRTRTFRMAPHALEPIRAWVTEREAAMNEAFDRLEALIEADEAGGAGP